MSGGHFHDPAFGVAAGVAGGVAFGVSAAPAKPSAASQIAAAANWGRNERMNNGWMQKGRMKSPNTRSCGFCSGVDVNQAKLRPGVTLPNC